MIRSKLLLVPLFFLSLAAAATFGTGADAAALSGSGYFSGNTGYWYSGYGGDVLSGRPGSNAVPGSVNTKGEFINYIRNRLGGSARDRTGAAFIVNLMVGASAGGGWSKDRTPSAGMLNDWEERIRDSSVSISREWGDPNAYGRISFYDSSINDDFFTSYGSGARELIIFRQGGQVKAVVEVPCGNPVGRATFLAPDFNLSGSSGVRATANPGDTVTFNHRVSNTGPGDMNRSMNAYAEWNGGVKDGDGVSKNCDDGNGLNDGQTTGNNCDDVFTIPIGAISGQRFCQRVVASPKSRTGGTEYSSRACVEVVARWTTGSSTGIPVPAGALKEGLDGDPYTFRHRVNNNGPDGVGQAGRGFIRVFIQERYNNESWSDVSGFPTDYVLGRTGSRVNDISGNLRAGFAAGDRYCQRQTIRYNGATGTSNSGNDDVTTACINGRREFNLIPSTSLNPGGGVEPGSSVQVTPVVNNEGPSLSRDDTDWLLARFVLPPGTAIPTTSTGAGAPCLYYANGCLTMSQGQGTFQYGNPSAVTGQSGAPYGPRTFSIPDPSAVGTKYCFALSVKPYTHTNFTDWRYGTPTCVTVGVKPKLTVWGYDTKVGSTINTSVSRISGRTYGSWGEYGVLSNGANAGMASGSGFVDGNGAANQESWSALTFANSTVAGLPQFGNYGGVTQFTANQSGAFVINGDTDLPAGSYNSPFGSGFKRVVRVTGTLTITDNLVYSNGPYGSIADIPRVVIIADDIVINSNVTRIDPWLVANRIATCTAANDAGNYFVPADRVSLSTGVCQNSLRFNGPVVANELYPYRTTDSGDDTDIAAEIFNLRADVFLSSYAGGGINTPVASTDLVIDVPPRF